MRPVTLLVFLAVAAVAAEPTPPPAPPKKIPPPGFTLTDRDRAELTTGADALGRDLAALARELAGEPRWLARLPDVEIFHKAVDWALRYDEFMAPKEVATARSFLAKGNERLAQLRARQAPWLGATGLVVRGYRSRLDGSVQPYGLVVPPSLARPAGRPQLLVWLLGRGEKRTELAFLAEREAGPPQLTPRDTLTLVPYGRFCNATKFAGEIDVMEALAAVREQYEVDPQRIAVAGFSMGGGSTWHLATHYPGLWAAAFPGAGFAETPVFTQALAPGREPRPAWEQRLWRLYDATLYAGNLFNVPTVAYSGEIDKQKQAADIMTEYLAAEGLPLRHLIGPQTAHKYHPETKAELTTLLEQALARGRPAVPAEIRFTTYTLRYADSAWVRVEGLEKHWERADVRARLAESGGAVTVETKNVTALSLVGIPVTSVTLDGQRLAVAGDRPLAFGRRGGTWRQEPPAEGRRKRPGLTGPIDDAFMEGFVFVRPTGRPFQADVAAWVEHELTAARRLWRDVYRGDVPVKADREVTEDDIASKHLVLWGDPSSNAVLGKILAKLPLQWDAKTLRFRGRTLESAHHAPILVFPNPLNPRRYVVLNSGLDFRAEGSANNALQTPKLPDWAIVDLRTAPTWRWPGRIVDAGFFDEEWK
jgi:pimeloyl-ACP methyl ester carboxylesterase